MRRWFLYLIPSALLTVVRNTATDTQHRPYYGNTEDTQWRWCEWKGKAAKMLPRKQFSAFEFGFHRIVFCASPITALSSQPHQSQQPLALRAINLHHHLCLDSTGAPSFCHQTGSMPSITHSPHKAKAQKTNKYISIVTSLANSDRCSDVTLRNVTAF